MSLGTRLAGPSRSVVPSLRATVLTSRNVMTIPHPSTVLPPSTSGGDHFQIKTQLRIRNTADAFAIVRAAEKALGSSIISVDVSRDPTSLKPFFFIYISTLTPVEFHKPILLDVPYPKLRDADEFGDVDPYGGPSLRDVMDVLNSAPTELAPGETGIQFRIEKLDARQTPRSGSFAPKSSKPKLQAQEEEQILNALEDKGGQWAEIAQRWSKLRKSPRSSASTNETSRTSITDILQDADEVAENLERGLAKEDQRRAKHSRHASRHPKETVQVSEEEDVIGKTRQRAGNVREELHKIRQAKASTLDSDAAANAAEIPTDDWTFSLTSDDSGPLLDDLKIAPGAQTRTAFSLENLKSKKKKREPQAEEEPTVPITPTTTFAPEPPVEGSPASGTEKVNRTRQQAVRLAQMEIEAKEKEAQRKLAQQAKAAEKAKARAEVASGAEVDAQAEAAAQSAQPPTAEPKESEESQSLFGRFFRK